MQNMVVIFKGAKTQSWEKFKLKTTVRGRKATREQNSRPYNERKKPRHSKKSSLPLSPSESRGHKATRRREFRRMTSPATERAQNCAAFARASLWGEDKKRANIITDS